MTRDLHLEPEAAADLAAAYQWYEAQRSPLGDSLIDAVEAALAWIAEHPEIFQVSYRGLRRAVVHRFP